MVAAGILWAIAFPVLGIAYRMQTFGDGALFSYAVAARSAWAFHWHNISARLFSFVAASFPAEIYVGLSGDPAGGVTLYGLLFFCAPLAGLAATFAIDRSAGWQFFVFGCASTASLCPLVFGCPTEMWMAHAVFWPALAAAHCARQSLAGLLLVFALIAALVFSHEGAVLLAGAIVVSLAPRGGRDASLHRAAAAFLTALLAWIAVKCIFPPDAYIAGILMRLALGVFDPAILDGDLLRLIVSALVGYALVSSLLWWLRVAKAEDWALVFVLALLATHWLWSDQTLHADNRYHLRTVLIVATPAFGLLAAIQALRAEGRGATLPRSVLSACAAMPSRALLRVLLILALIHAVETAKFTSAWSAYREAVRTLAAGSASDPRLGDPRFVSTDRLDSEAARLGWDSTSPYLSVLVTPGFAPARLAVAPEVNFFWISCKTATASAERAGALPAATRDMLQVYSCLHRRN